MKQTEDNETIDINIFTKACAHGDMNFIKNNIDKLKSINELDLSGSTALITAVTNNRYELTEFLLNHGADINAHNGSGWTALHIAVAFDIADYERDVDPDNLDPNHKPDSTMIELLFKYHPDIEIKTNEGYTVLDLASYWEVLKNLVEKKKKKKKNHPSN